MEQSHVRSAATFGEWVNAYQALAYFYVSNKHCTGLNAESKLREKLNHDCNVLISRRKQVLRESDDYLFNKIGTAAAGFLPFAKGFVSHGLGKDFARTTLRTFGLGDGNKMKQFQEAFQGKFNSKTKLALNIAGTGAEEVASDILHHAMTDGGSEAVHAQPVIGQFVSMGMGYYSMRKKMLNMISTAGDKAELIHQGLIIPHIINQMRPQMSELGKDSAIVHIEEMLPELESPGLEQRPRSLMGQVPYCFNCEKRVQLDEIVWFITWEEHAHGLETICSGCKERIESLNVKDYKRLFACLTTVRNASMDEDWACMADNCPTMEKQEGLIDGIEYDYRCSECDYVRCYACLNTDTDYKCPACSARYDTMHSPIKRCIAPEAMRGSSRPFFVCSHCDDVQSQTALFTLCESCLYHGERAIFCAGCSAFGVHEAHLKDCKYTSPPPKVRISLVVPRKREEDEEYICKICELLYDPAVPSAWDWDLEHQICYICFFKASTDLGPYCDQGDKQSQFQFWIPDQPRTEQPEGKYSNYISMPVLAVPKKFQSVPKESPAAAARTWAKEKGASEAVEHGITDAIHWLTISHIGLCGAGQMGLNTIDAVDPNVPLSCLPALGLPALPNQNFINASDINFEGIELPDLDFDDPGSAASGGDFSFNQDAVDICPPTLNVDPTDLVDLDHFDTGDNLSLEIAGLDFN